MPWLIKSTPKEHVPLQSRLFLVHVPRCGGTSLMQHFSVPRRVVESRGFVRAWAMRYFFLRYGELEKANFPVRTRENAVCWAVLLVSGLALWADGRGWGTPLPSLLGLSLPYWLGGLAAFVSLFTTVVCTAPVIGRITPVHRWYLWFVHYPIFRLCEAVDWCTGTNKHGYIMHLTAAKLLGYGYVKPEEMDNMCSLAIVRNPYSRMVSIYGYNRFGECESFPAFLRRWKRLMRPYSERGEKEEWYTPCHLLPMFEYTHFNGRQVVQSVVKQEELKLLKTREGAREAMEKDSSVSNLPDIVRDALLGMPHTNRRATGKRWYDYYDQETMELTHEMYARDFQVFGYPVAIKERPDLVPPVVPTGRRKMLGDTRYQLFSRNSFMDADGTRGSRMDLLGSVRKSVRGEMFKRSSTTALKASIAALDRDEVLASVAGIRRISAVRETFREGSGDTLEEEGDAKKDD